MSYDRILSNNTRENIIMGKTKLTVSMNKTMKKELKILALKQDTTASKIIESCIKKYLEKYSDL